MPKHKLNRPSRLVRYHRPRVRRKRCSYVSFRIPGPPATVHHVARTLKRHRANLKTPVYGFFIVDAQVRAVVGGTDFNIREYARGLVQRSVQHSGDLNAIGDVHFEPVLVRATSYGDAMKKLRGQLIWARRWCLDSHNKRRMVDWWLPQTVRCSQLDNGVAGRTARRSSQLRLPFSTGQSRKGSA